MATNQSSTASSTDRIERKIRLAATRTRVWRALTEPSQFGKWFGVDLRGEVAPGKTLRGQITSHGWTHVTFEVTVETVEPETRYAFRWHPYAVEPGVDYSSEPTTLIEFMLEEVPGGTMLTVVESGFDRIPASRRAKAFEMDSQGWTQQMENIKRYLAA